MITENHKAIKAYESVGFDICKNYRCYSGTISVNQHHFELQEVRFEDIDWNYMPHQNLYSWDNYYESLRQGDYQYFKVLTADKMSSYFVINPEKRISSPIWSC